MEAAEKLHATLLVLGTRGMGSIKRSLMSLIGMGSVRWVITLCGISYTVFCHPEFDAWLSYHPSPPSQ